MRPSGPVAAASELRGVGIGATQFHVSLVATAGSMNVARRPALMRQAAITDASALRIAGALVRSGLVRTRRLMDPPSPDERRAGHAARKLSAVWSLLDRFARVIRDV